MTYATDGHWECSRCQSFGKIKPNEDPHCDCDEAEDRLRSRLAAVAEQTNGYWNGGPVAETDESAHARARAALRAIARALEEPF